MHIPCLRIIYLALVCMSAWLGITAATDQEWDTCIYQGKRLYYNSDDEGCCQGNILPRSPTIEEICCGSQLYDSSSGMCCDSTWYDRDTHFCCNDEVYARSEQTECCEERPMNTTTHTCCSGHTIDGTGECCGDSAVYDTSTQHCCLGPDDAGHVHTVGRDAVDSGFLDCCNTEAFHTRNELCCQGSPRDRRTPFTECCGPDTFDTRTDVCCEVEYTGEYRVSPLVDGRVECCRLTPYNKDNDQCCNSVVTPNIGDGNCCSSIAYNRLRSSCCNPHGNNPVSLSIPEIPGVQDCCSGESYLKTKRVCCSGTLHDLESSMECCGTGLYDPSDSLCCNGHVVDRPSPMSQCCGDSATFDTERQTCCYGHVSDIVNGSCCRIGRDHYRAYDSVVDRCCERENLRGPTYGKVHSVDTKCCGFHELSDNQLCNGCLKKPMEKGSADDNKVCCGRRNPATFNTKTQICKEGRVTSKRVAQDGQESCGVYVFNTATEQCCNGHVRFKTFEIHKSFPMECCGTETYVPKWQTCVDNIEVVKNIPDRVAGKCRGTVYNNATHMCDEGGRIRPIAEMEEGLEACDNMMAERGYLPYDPAEKQCCGDGLIGPGETCCNNQRFVTPGTAVEDGGCCGLVGYNPDTHMCCDEVLHQITAEGQECCGRHLYDSSSVADLCCNGMLYNSTEDGKTECTTGVAHRPTDTVCDGVVHQVENGRCCGKVVMDINLHICCQQNFVYEKAAHVNACCGRVAYNSSDATEKCCAGSLFHEAQNSICCHNQIMDPFIETCQAVGDVSYTLPRNKDLSLCSEGDYDPTRQTCCQGLLYNFLGECCGNEVIRKSNSNVICCGDRKQNHDFGKTAICCGGDVFDEKKHTCCGDVGLPKNHWWKTCCDGVITGRMKCRASQNPPRRPFGLGPSTCGGRLYNASFQGCCNNILYDSELYGCRDNIVKPLCGGVPYDNDTLVCCSGETHDSSATGCCDGKPFDLLKRTCCGMQLSHVKNGACCGHNRIMPYNRNRYLCCDNTLRRKKNGRRECCGSSSYNPNTDTCCGSKVTRGVLHGTCCGSRVFDPTKKMCCPETGTLYRRRAGLEIILDEGCCSPGMEYSTDAGTCIPQACDMCKAPRSTDGWQQHIHKLTLVRGMAVNVTSTASHHILQLTRVSHLNHNKRESRLDSQELYVAIPLHCGCGELQLDKAYVIMSDANVEGSQDFRRLNLRSTDFLARARNKLGTKIKHRLCRINES